MILLFDAVHLVQFTILTVTNYLLLLLFWFIVNSIKVRKKSSHLFLHFSTFHYSYFCEKIGIPFWKMTFKILSELLVGKYGRLFLVL